MATGIPFVVGASPAYMVGGKVNDVIMANDYEEAVKALGYSDNWEGYGISEAVYTQFVLYQQSPAFFVNILDPSKHKKEVSGKKYEVAENQIALPLETIAESVEIEGKKKGTDFEVFYNDTACIVEFVEDTTGEMTVSCTEVDPSKVTKADIIGGYSIATHKTTGLELIDDCFPKYRIVPDLILCPNWSHDPEVAAVMSAKGENINGLFEADALLDVDTREAYGKKTGRRNVLHLSNMERIDQRRGVPFLAPVIEALKQLGRYTNAELIAAVISGLFTVFIEKDSNEDGEPIGSGIAEEELIDEDDENSLELGPGAILDLAEGEKAHDINPGRPNKNFNGFVEAICRQIGAALEIPYELLLKHFTSSYSASRGALEEAWKMFKMYRAWMANDFCQPVYEEWLAEAVAKGRINAPGFFTDPLRRKAYCKAQWNGPARGLLNPVQEVGAAVTRVENGFSTRSAETMEMAGGDFYSNCEQLKQEEKKLKEVKKIVNAGEQKPGSAAGQQGNGTKPGEPAEQQDDNGTKPGEPAEQKDGDGQQGEKPVRSDTE